MCCKSCLNFEAPKLFENLHAFKVCCYIWKVRNSNLNINKNCTFSQVISKPLSVSRCNLFAFFLKKLGPRSALGFLTPLWNFFDNEKPATELIYIPNLPDIYESSQKKNTLTSLCRQCANYLILSYYMIFSYSLLPDALDSPLWNRQNLIK